MKQGSGEGLLRLQDWNGGNQGLERHGALSKNVHPAKSK